MLSRKQSFKNACKLMILFALVIMIPVAVFAFNRQPLIDNVIAQYPEIASDYVMPMIYGGCGAFILVHLLMGIWGLVKVKKKSTGVGHIIFGSLLLLIAVFNLYHTIDGFVAIVGLAEQILNILFPVIWIVILFIYDWHAIIFRRALKEHRLIK